MRSKLQIISEPKHTSVHTPVFALQELFSHYHEGLMVINTNRELVYINTTALGILQMDVRPCYQQVSDKLTQLINDSGYLAALFEENGVISKSFPDDHIFSSYRLESFPVVSEGNKPVAVAISFKEIMQSGLETTEQKAMWAARMKFRNMAQFEYFMDNSPITAWATDEEGTMLYVNKAFREFTSMGDIVGKNLYDIFPEDMAALYIDNNLQAIKKGKTIETIERLFHPDGRELVTKVYKFPYEINGRKIVGGWSVDITDHIHLQEELKKSNERYDFVNKATSDAIYDWDISNQTCYAGNGFDHLFGRKHITPALSFCKAYIHPEDLRNMLAAIFTTLNNPDADRWEIKYRFLDSQNQYRFVLDRAFIIRNNNKPVRVIGALQDITEQITLQNRLVETEKNNSREVLRQVIEAQESERESLSKELHDNVNQILSSCKLMLEVACEFPEKAPLLTRKSYDNIQKVIAEIRKMSHHLSPYTVADIGVVASVKSLVEDINLTGKMKVGLELTPAPGEWLITLDGKMAIYRIIQELLNNVVKHSQAKKVFIRLGKKDHLIQIEVSDDGVGCRADTVQQGIGFKNILNRIHKYHGNLQVSSKPGKGCKVSVKLDMKEDLKAFEPLLAQPL